MSARSIESANKLTHICDRHDSSAAGETHHHCPGLGQPGSRCTCVDNLVVAHLLHSGQTISTTLIQSVLDLVNNPIFDKSVLTLKTVSDVFAFEASPRIEAASNRSRSAATLREFPPVILDNIIDVIESERVLPYVSEGMFVEEPNHPDPTREGDRVISTLAIMALVHSSWTWPAQMAMGREISIACNERDAIGKMRDAVSSIRCGPWTRRLLLDYSHDQPPGRRRPHRMLIFSTEERERDLELSRILAEILKRTPNLQQLSLCWSWPVFGAATNDEFFTDLFGQVASLKHLEALSISGTLPQQSNIVMRSVARLVSDLPCLKAVSLAILSWRPPSGIMTPNNDNGTFNETFGNAVTEGLRPPRCITALCVKVGEMLSLPLLGWIADTPHIRHLKLCVGVDSIQIRDQMDLLGGIAARASSFALLHTLNISSNSYQPDSSQETIMLIKIIRHCISLRILCLKPYNHLNMQMLLENLPKTLTQFVYHPLHSFKEGLEPTVESFDSALSCWINSTSFQSSRLMHVNLYLSCCVYTEPETEWDWIRMKALSNPPFPTLPQTLAACESKGVQLQVDWDRTILPKPPTPPPIWYAHPLDWTLETAGAPEV